MKAVAGLLALELKCDGLSACKVELAGSSLTGVGTGAAADAPPAASAVKPGHCLMISSMICELARITSDDTDAPTSDRKPPAACCAAFGLAGWKSNRKLASTP